MQLRNLLGLGSGQKIDLADLILSVPARVVEQIICLEDAGVHLDHGVLSHKRIYQGLKHIGALGLGKVVVGLKGFIRLRVYAHTGSAVR